MQYAYHAIDGLSEPEYEAGTSNLKVAYDFCEPEEGFFKSRSGRFTVLYPFAYYC
jgi:hypothetical protein